MSSKSPDENAAAVGRFDAPAGWRAIDFLSDLHLDAAHPRTFEGWRHELLDTPADAVFLLGDVFEAWVGDDARHQGFERACAAVLAEAARRRAVAFLPGNRDFLVGREMLDACGVTLLADPTLLTAWGSRWLLAHGDALCSADLAYQQFRAQVREPAWQRAFLARPLAERQALARHMRETSEATKAGQSAEAWADVDADAALMALRDAGATQLLHGHTHKPGRVELHAGHARHVLSDWDFDVQPSRGDVLRLTPTGLQRLTPAQALQPLAPC